jgi:PhnB protein
MPAKTQRIIPYLAYRDAPGAIEFLCKAFGFEERYRYPMPDGRIGHAELQLGDDVIFLASEHEGFIVSPLSLSGVNAQVHVCVDDVDAHHRRARDAGATIAAAPEDQPYGMRMYRALDLEGHKWIFAKEIAEAK